MTNPIFSFCAHVDLLGRMTLNLINQQNVLGPFLAGLLIVPFFIALMILLVYLLLWRDTWIPENQMHKFLAPDAEQTSTIAAAAAGMRMCLLCVYVCA